MGEGIAASSSGTQKHQRDKYYLFLPKLLLSHMHKSLPELHGIPAEVPNFLDSKFKSFLAFQICRDILVRDAVRFHKFNNGTCSCGNFCCI
uniref:DYW domain-containing protein n=1 Tax=Oryza meridionalis TaxID=40149 RepID=A0A0E0CHL4_9ORYZ